MYTGSDLEPLGRDPPEFINVQLNARILPHDNISPSMITKRAVAEDSQVAMLLRALQGDLCANAVMKIEQDRRVPVTFQFDKLQKHILSKCATLDALAILDLNGSHTAPAVSPYSIEAAITLLQIPVVVILQRIVDETTPVVGPLPGRLSHCYSQNTINRKMSNMIEDVDTSTCNITKPNELCYSCYKTA